MTPSGSNPKVTNVGQTPLLLLRRIRDIMAGSDAAQAKLDQIVKVIASGLSSEVCSIYLLRAGDVLELFASEGLNPSSVHSTRLGVGEGLVGDIVAQRRTLNLANAQAHPKFAYRPETGEEIYHSFVGAPIWRNERVIGVLVVQSKESRSFEEEVVEVLETVTMVLSELIASNKIVDEGELKRATSGALLPRHLAGLRLSPGLARGGAVIHRRRAVVTKVVAEDIHKETERLNEAVSKLQQSVSELIREQDLREDDEQREILEAYLLLTQDSGWVERIKEAIETGLTAEAAVQKVQDGLNARMQQMTSQVFKDKIADLDDLHNRLIDQLTGGGKLLEDTEGLPPRFILVAKSLGPAELLEYGRRRIKGLILEEGSATSHIVIIARAMDVPVVGKIEKATQIIQSGDPVVVDGDNGEIYIRPSNNVVRSIDAQIKASREKQAEYAAMKALPTATTDGAKVNLYINAGLFVDIKRIHDIGADGVGLYRTELPYMVASHFPEVAAQVKIYGKAVRQAQGKRVIFRTFDIGGDKQVPYFNTPDEENPAMGWRAIRIALDRPSILRAQYRALIEAVNGGELDLMFPFVAEIAEFDAMKVLLDQELKRAQKDGIALPSALRLGTMIEVPSILWQLPALMERVDFVSVGSNDLMQFLFACDRGSTEMSNRYDTLSPTFLRVLRNVLTECEKAGVTMSFCGEMARYPLDAMVLVGLGVRHLSMPPSSIGPIKAMIRSLDAADLSAYLETLLTSDVASLRNRFELYAKDHGIAV